MFFDDGCEEGRTAILCLYHLLAKCVTHLNTHARCTAVSIDVLNFMSVHVLSLCRSSTSVYDVAMNDIREIMDDGRMKKGKVFIIGRDLSVQLRMGGDDGGRREWWDTVSICIVSVEKDAGRM